MRTSPRRTPRPPSSEPAPAPRPASPPGSGRAFLPGVRRAVRQASARGRSVGGGVLAGVLLAGLLAGLPGVPAGAATVGEAPGAPVDALADPAGGPETDTGSGTGTDTASAAAAARTFQIQVGSFNVRNVTFAKRPTRNWRERRRVIIDEILDQKIQLLGIQEAHPGRFLDVAYPDGENQYLDLKNGLNKAGGHFRLTDPTSFNCEDGHTWRNCRYRDRGASRGTRILYNAAKFAVLDKGSVLFRRQAAGDDRYLVWAKVRHRATGRELLFATTHLVSGHDRIRLAQWRQLKRKVARLGQGLPVVVAGDFNVQKYHWIAGRMLPAMKRAGFGDVLNQEFRTNPVRRPRAEKSVHGWVNSYNHNRTDVATFSYNRQRHKTGNNIDWIFASNRLRVSEWRVVLRFNPRTLQVRGTLPSDHNLVKAVLHLNRPR